MPIAFKLGEMTSVRSTNTTNNKNLRGHKIPKVNKILIIY